ncbi:hypothetical protein [Agrobacterium tumefaciens]|uniref:hypothetical protein n=1 Tax=Agrobacterium tumefaciens TaxID=358 RepID=UPI000977B547|nr:hypothetical protein BV900_10930 [Agrobacterium tumefaciens]
MNNHQFAIGTGEHQFTLQFSKGSDVTIRMYNDPADIDRIAVASNASRFEDVRDASVFNYTSRDIAVDEGQIVALKNVKGNYALVHIHDIRDNSRPGDDCDEVTFSYAINPSGKTNFA